MNQGDLITSFLIITIAIATIISYAFRGLKQYEQKFLSPVIAINIETGGRLILGYLLGITLGWGIYGVLVGSLIAMAASTIP